jgi:predicted secreted protein
MADSDTSVPFWWVVLFLLLALGAGAFAIVSSGGSIVGSTAFLL